MTEGTKPLIVYGAVWCPDVFMARRYLDRHGVAYEYRDIDKVPEAKAALLDIAGAGWVVPTIVMPDGEVLHSPSVRELADKLGRPSRKKV